MTVFLIAAVTIAVLLSATGFFFRDEINSTKERDPAATGAVQVILLYTGFHAIVLHRIAHAFWLMRLKFFARWLSQVSRFLTGTEIHPGAKIGRGLFIDHGMGVVIGETSIVGDNVTLFQGVTLGGTGKETGKRHPTVGDNVVIGAGAKVLGNIEVGANSYVGANAVILRDVPENSTVVGVPGHVTKQDGKKLDLMMDHVHVSDPMMQNLKDLVKRVHTLENELKDLKKDKKKDD